MNEREQMLTEAARAARLNAHAPFSKFQVGAAFLTKDGRVFAGCNIENSSFGLTVCGERVALFNAIAAGCQPGDFVLCAVAADGPVLAPPCGACRQVMFDLCGDIEIILINSQNEEQRHRLSDLFPKPFGAHCFVP